MIRGTLIVSGAAAIVACGCGGPRAPLGPPTTVASGGVSNPTVARSGDALVVAWVGVDGNVYVARRGPDGSYAKPARANDVAGEAAPHEQAPAQVASGPNGAVYVIWQTRVPIAGRRFPASDLRFAHSADGGRTFEPALTINDDRGGKPSSHTFHDLLVDAHGTVFVSWIDGRTTEEAHHGGADHHHGDSSLGPEIRAARSTDGGKTFSASVVVDRDACPCCRTSLARGPDGTLYIAWRKVYSGDVRDVVVARSTDGGVTFEAPVRVHRDNWVYPGCPHAGPSLAVDSAGTLHVVWYTGAEGHTGLYLATSRDGARTFGEPVALRRGRGFVSVSNARLAATGSSVWVAWEDRAASGGRVQLGRCGPDGVLRPQGSFNRPGHSPAIVAGPAGVAVAWLAGDSILVAAAP
jgi:hypothetical protein